MILGKFLKDNELVFLDSMVFIYFFEADTKKREDLQYLFRVIEEGTIRAITSSLTISEVLVKPYKLKNIGLIDEYLRFFNEFPYLSIVPLSQEIAVQASRIRATQGYKTPDAIQLATAIELNAKGFITGDKQLSLKGLSFFYI